MIGSESAAKAIVNHVLAIDLQSKLEFVRESPEKEKIITAFQEDIRLILVNFCGECEYLGGLSK